MSKTKAVHIGDRMVWVFDNSHDVVLAHMIEAAESLRVLDEDTLHGWRALASINDIALSWKGEVPPEMFEILRLALAAIEAKGDLVRSDLVGWSVLDGVDVSDGFLRSDRLPVEALLDTLDGFGEMFAGELAPDPPGGWWLLGVPGGRQVIARRADA